MMLKVLSLILCFISLASFCDVVGDRKNRMMVEFGSLNINGKFYNLDKKFKRGKFSVVYPFIAKRFFEMIFGGGAERRRCDFEIFSMKAGPFGNNIGSKRYVPPALEIKQLPKIDFVIISHNHYDHLAIASPGFLDGVVKPYFKA